MTTETANSNALAELPHRRHIRPKRNDPAHDFMSGNTALCGIGTLDIASVRTADAASLDGDQHLT